VLRDVPLSKSTSQPFLADVQAMLPSCGDGDGNGMVLGDDGWRLGHRYTSAPPIRTTIAVLINRNARLARAGTCTGSIIRPSARRRIFRLNLG
jgi:hypothetical protein